MTQGDSGISIMIADLSPNLSPNMPYAGNDNNKGQDKDQDKDKNTNTWRRGGQQGGGESKANGGGVGKAQATATTITATLIEKHTKKAQYSLPTVPELTSFFNFGGPLFVILLIKTALWSYTTVAVSAAGTCVRECGDV